MSKQRRNLTRAEKVLREEAWEEFKKNGNVVIDPFKLKIIKSNKEK